MIEGVRNRLITLIISILAIVLITAFIAIYILTYIRTNNDNAEKLKFNETLFILESEGELTYDENVSKAIVLNRIFLDNGIYFNLIVDENGSLILIDSALQLTDETYQSAASAAFENTKKTLEFEGRKWQYIISCNNVIIEGIQSVDYDKMYVIRLMDVTDSFQMLKMLKYTLVFIGIVMLVVFYFLSRFFSNIAIQPLVESWDKQRQFVADASHELKTPISIINANVGVLYDNKDETISSQLKWLNYIESGTKRMSILINNLLSLAKIEDYSTYPNNIELNLDELIGDAIEGSNAYATSKKIKIEESLSSGITIYTDYAMLRQVIDILIDNAIKYSPENGIIYITSNQTKQHIVIKVENGGVGISKDDLLKIFDRFYRTDKSRSHNSESYGLGLAIASSIMNKLGGKIIAESIPNEITTFILKFNIKHL